MSAYNLKRLAKELNVDLFNDDDNNEAGGRASENIKQTDDYSRKFLEKKGIPFEEFNVLIGLPKRPSDLKELQLAPYQMELFNIVNSRKYFKRIENKGRQMGFTEIKQRINAYGAFNWYAGKKIINIAGTREKTAKEIQYRIRSLFNNIENTIADNGTDLWFKLKNGTEIMALPSNPGAIRGLTKVGSISVDEAAHFDLVDDTPVLNAIVPLSDTNHADLDILSTPNGQRGFFYTIWNDPNSDFMKLEYNIWKTEGNIYTKEEILRMLANTSIDVQQEFLCQFTTSRNSIFGNRFITADFEVEVY